MLKKTTLAIAVMAAALSAEAAKEKNITLDLLGTYETGIFDDGAAEIVSYDPMTQRVFVINAADSIVELLDISDPSNPVKVNWIDVAPDIADAFPGSASGGINSVAVKNGIVAVAVENDNKQDNGWAAFYDVYGSFLGAVEAGALPDMVTFTPNGQYALVANEGEPSDDYAVDPEGSVTVIDLRKGFSNLPGMTSTADFRGFNGATLPEGMRAPRPFGATFAQDLEPEYIATSHDSRTAWVVLQENNAVAEIDIRSATVTKLVGLGSKDHSQEENALDASNRDDKINIQPWPVNGLFMPDSIVAYRTRGKTYLVTANEGDGREYIYETESAAECKTPDGSPVYEFDDGECIVYLDEERIKDLSLDPTAFPDAAYLQEDKNLGRLKAVATEGDTDGDGDYDQLYSFGARSITVWDAETFVGYDTGSTIEDVTATLFPDDFNSTNDENGSFDSRSDDKGPEPETAIVGKAFGRQYAFVGLERVGGVMIFDVTEPEKAIRYVDYVNNRDFAVEDVESSEVGDLGPEGLFYIKADDSPIDEPLLVVGNEVSGTTSIYQVKKSD
ncbi:MAG: choice-of-anchor I family protein [Sedimenticolaceae bacterium]